MKKLKALERLEDSFNKLPSVGKKSAERMAYAILDMQDDDVEEFSNALKELKEKIHRCPICGNLTEEEICDICMDKDRDQTTMMIVSYPKDIISFENSEGYNGLYHCLHGVLSPSKGMDINLLNYQSLVTRLEKGEIKEIILATNPTIEGETTALYLAKKLEIFNVNVTRLAYGLQMGGNLDYTDSLTLAKALEGRTKI